jgi:peptide/nickel transport system permease protein
MALIDPAELGGTFVGLKGMRARRRVRSRLVLRARNLTTGNRISLVLFGVIALVTLLAPVLASRDPVAPAGRAFLAPGHGGYLLGTDESGRDMFSRMLFGMRSSFWSTLAVIAIALVVGAIIGTIAGATGGIVDAALMRFTDVFLALPGTLLAIAVVGAFGASLRNTLLAVAAVWWPWYARIVRNETWALTARPHIEAARLAGTGAFRRSTRHLFPGVIGPLLVTASLDAGALLVTLAALSFFGLGAPPPQPELGAMTARGLSYLLDFWWIPLLPAIGVALLAFIANLAGESVRSLVDEHV